MVLVTVLVISVVLLEGPELRLPALVVVVVVWCGSAAPPASCLERQLARHKLDKLWSGPGTRSAAPAAAALQLSTLST